MLQGRIADLVPQLGVYALWHPFMSCMETTCWETTCICLLQLVAEAMSCTCGCEGAWLCVLTRSNCHVDMSLSVQFSLGINWARI
jgi:hypothetical protein